MSGLNPYNCSAPGNLFVGYERLRQEMLNGFRNGRSYAILGGRRCGKTSLLMQIAVDLQNEGLAPLTPIPRLLDIQSLGRYSPRVLFEQMYALVAQEVGAPPFLSSTEGQEYQDFLAALDKAKPLLDQCYGADWVVILLIDELDAAIGKLPDDQFFQNLRNLLMMSRFHRHFRLVASGVTGMANLISSGSSPLNNLRNKHLGILTGKQVRQLIVNGFHNGLDPEVELALLQLTGRHPYLLQGLLEKLWDVQPAIDKLALKNASREFLREHHDFDRWLESFDEAGHAVYQALANAPEGTLHARDLRQKIASHLAPKVDEALTILSYHGVIDDSDPDEPQIAGTMFRDWYRDNAPRQENKASEPERPQAIRVFYSYSHKDEAFREELDAHLAQLRRASFIEAWHDRKILPGEQWEDAISQNLEAANIVILLVSADFLNSDYCYEKEMKQAIERHDDGKACVIPIITRPADWHGAPFGKLQVLPKDAKAVTLWLNRDEAWVNVAQGIRRAVEELRKR
jgi:hypothetical protein